MIVEKILITFPYKCYYVEKNILNKVKIMFAVPIFIYVKSARTAHDSLNHYFFM